MVLRMEADGLADERLVGVVAAALAADRAGALLHDDRVSVEIEYPGRGLRVLRFLESDDVGVEPVGDRPHRLIVSGAPRLAAGAVLLGEEFEVPAGDPQAVGRALRRMQRLGRGARTAREQGGKGRSEGEARAHPA
jgi:hypothetical protein